MTIQELKSLIAALRAETQQDSVSPDSLGAILDKIVDVIEAHISPLDKLATLADTAELPAKPTKSEQSKLYLIDGHLYAYVDEVWKDCGSIKGEKGDKGDKGDAGAVIDGVALADSIEAIDSAQTPAETVPTANVIKEINDNAAAITEDITDTKIDIYGGTRYELINGKELVSSTGHYIKYNLETGALSRAASDQYYEWRIPNRGYNHIKAYVQEYLASPASYGVAVIAFYSSETGYTAPENCIVRARASLKTYETDIPEWVTTIVVTARFSSAANLNASQITVSLPIEVQALTSCLERIESLESGIQKPIEIGERLQNIKPEHLHIDEVCQEITPSDKSEIPPYFLTRPESPTADNLNSYLETKIQSVPDGKHFIFVTDTHWRYNTKKSPALIQYVRKRIAIPFVIFGGDAMHRPANQDTETAPGSGIWQLKSSLWHTAEESRVRAQTELSEYCSVMKEKFGDHFIFVTGNHDLGLANLSGYTAADKAIMRVPYQSILNEAHTSIKRRAVYDEEGIENIALLNLDEETAAELAAYIKQCYYVDDDAQKIRFIVTYTGQGNGYDGVAETVFGLSGSDCLCSQLKFIGTALMTLPDGYDVVFTGHWFYQRTSSKTQFMNGFHWLCRMINAYRAGTSYTISTRSDTTAAFSTWNTATSRVRNFAALTWRGRILFVAGHNHTDHAEVITQSSSDFYTGSLVAYSFDIYPYSDDEATRLRQYLGIVVHRDGGTAYQIPGTTATGGTIPTDCAFDIITITDDNRVVCTRIGYGNDREYALPEMSPEEFNGKDSDEPEEGGIDDED